MSNIQKALIGAGGAVAGVVSKAKELKELERIREAKEAESMVRQEQKAMKQQYKQAQELERQQRQAMKQQERSQANAAIMHMDQVLSRLEENIKAMQYQKEKRKQFPGYMDLVYPKDTNITEIDV